MARWNCWKCSKEVSCDTWFDLSRNMPKSVLDEQNAILRRVSRKRGKRGVRKHKRDRTSGEKAEQGLTVAGAAGSPSPFAHWVEARTYQAVVVAIGTIVIGMSAEVGRLFVRLVRNVGVVGSSACPRICSSFPPSRDCGQLFIGLRR